ncbi:MAG: hypothetical protein ACLSG8_09785 [Barnesiella sp.]
MKITKRVFGYAASGEPVFLFRLVLDNGAYAEICNYGATLVSVVVPGKKDGSMMLCWDIPAWTAIFPILVIWALP